MARPRLVVNPDMIKALAAIHCTYDEIAAVIGCSTKTLQRRFVRLIEKERDGGKASLRREQWKKALAGDKTMLIWLGKQHLGQADQTNYTFDPSKLTDDELADIAQGKALPKSGGGAPGDMKDRLKVI